MNDQERLNWKVSRVRSYANDLLNEIDDFRQSPGEYQAKWKEYADHMKELSGALRQFLHDTGDRRGAA